MFLPSRRRELLLLNLSYAFPGLSKQDKLAMARESASRMIEMGLFSIMNYYLCVEKKTRY